MNFKICTTYEINHSSNNSRIFIHSQIGQGNKKDIMYLETRNMYVYFSCYHCLLIIIFYINDIWYWVFKHAFHSNTELENLIAIFNDFPLHLGIDLYDFWDGKVIWNCYLFDSVLLITKIFLWAYIHIWKWKMSLGKTLKITN